MSTQQSKGKRNVSLKKAFIILICVSVCVSVFLLCMLKHAFTVYYSLIQSIDNYIVAQEATSKLLRASDYLTEEAQCYAVTGDREHLDNYISEIVDLRNRDKALMLMEEKLPETEALTDLIGAIQESEALTVTEYYAMFLMMAALNDKAIPVQMQNIKLDSVDATLTNDAKILKAQQLLHNEAYYKNKTQIYNYLNQCISTLDTELKGTQRDVRIHLYVAMMLVGIFILFQTGEVLLLLFLTHRWGLKPILQAVIHIKHNQKLPLEGSEEYKYLAEAYNDMFSNYQKDIKNLSFKAYHDTLTGLYNRAGYDLIVKNIEKENTVFLLIDTDRFKEVNDMYGHDVGDRVLIKLAETLKSNFRPDDYIFRIGGDEFVVLMEHVTADCELIIREKVASINAILADINDGLPRLSVSVGVAKCSDALDFQNLYHNADKALYKIKERGRSDVYFYYSAHFENI